MVCGCVAFDKRTLKKVFHNYIPKIDDSKKLSPKQRDVANKWIRKNCLTWGVGIGTVAEINKGGIVSATSSGFRRAVANASLRLKARVNFILVDAFYIPYVRGLNRPLFNAKKANAKKGKAKISGKQLAIINGDEKSFSIAAASIIAKVYRDKMMILLAAEKKYKSYGWDKNKGYGTKIHIDALKKLGPTKLHRKKFITKYLS